MSMAVHIVLPRNRAPDAETWQRVMTEWRVPMQLSEYPDLDTHSGFTPLTVCGSDSKFFFMRDDLADLAHLYAPLFQLKVEEPASLRWDSADTLSKARPLSTLRQRS